jgi:GH15 family glucan-1,4-alpha-glucosidase
VSNDDRYAPIADYALIGDCRSAALVSRKGSIDWCCQPRFDSGTMFARLLDHERGGFCQIVPAEDGEWQATREYVEDSLVLETTLRGEAGDGRLLDCFLVRDPDDDAAPQRILRVLEGRRGRVEFEIRIAPRFDYGEVRPWIRRHGAALAQRDRRQRRVARVVRTRVARGSGPRARRPRHRERRRSRPPGTVVHTPELVGEDPPEPGPRSITISRRRSAGGSGGRGRCTSTAAMSQRLAAWR